MNELCIVLAKEPFNDAAKAGLARRSHALVGPQICDKRFKVLAFEFLSLIGDHRFREPVMALNAISNDHHAGAVTRLVKEKDVRTAQQSKGN